MILTKEVKIRVLNRLVNFYSEKGYEALHNKEIFVKIEDLSHGANAIVVCRCEICDTEFSKKFRLVKIEDDGSTHCSKCKLSDSAKKRVKKYGSNFQNPNIQRKIATKYSSDKEKLKIIDKQRKATKKKQYGDENWNNQDKRLNTIKEKGTDWNNSDKRKQTCLSLYGNKNWNNQDQKRKTCMEKYGVEHTQQLEHIFMKTCKFQKFKDRLLYQGSFEKDFLENFFDCVNIERGKTFFYTDENGKQRRYFSDFFLPDFNLIIEIKSTYTLKCDKNRELKRQSTLELGYSFMWIIDKNYDVLVELLKDTINVR